MSNPNEGLTRLVGHDIRRAERLLPPPLIRAMIDTSRELNFMVVVAGGFLRSVVTGEKVNDIDVFTSSYSDARRLAEYLVKAKFPDTLPEVLAEVVEKHVHESDNAFTVKCYNPVIQIIHRWTFATPQDVIRSFDFSVCCAAMWYDETNKEMVGYALPQFYPDLAAKRLTYLSPVRNEDAGGSTVRVLKYYGRGYRIPLSSYAAVLARLFKGVDLDKMGASLADVDESALSDVLCGLLREVDPAFRPAGDGNEVE